MTNTSTKSGKTAFALSLATILIGVGVLIGWAFDVETLKSLIPGLVGMNPATAITFIFAGTSLALSLCLSSGYQVKFRPALIWIARCCALLAAGVGAAKLGGIIWGVDLPLDQWLFAAKLPDGHPFPNRLAPNTAFNFLLLGGALLCVDAQNRRTRFCLEVLVGVVSFGSLVAVLGHAYHIVSFYNLGNFSPMSFYAGITFGMMSLAFFLSHTDGGFLAIMVGDSASGGMARRLLPVAVFAPAGLGWLTLHEERTGIFYPEFGEALLVAGNIIIFVTVICWSAQRLFTGELARKKVEETLRLLNSAVLQSKESILITGPDLNFPGPEIIFVNPAFTKMTGYSEEEVLGKTPRILQGPRTDRAVLDRLRRNLEAGDVFEGETINYRKDGEAFDLEWQIAPLRDASGTITHFVAIQRDISARRQTELETRLNEQRYRLLVEATAAIVWSTPASGHFETPQPGWTAFTGQSFEELRGWGWLNAIHPDDQEETNRIWSTAVAERLPYKVEHRLRAGDGAYHDMMVRGVPILDKSGEIVDWIGVHTDITERKRMEAQLFQSQKMETVGKLAGGIAHEFNSILTAIMGQSELIQHDLPEGSALAHNATEISKAAERAATLTRQILAYGRKQILQPEVLDLNLVLAEMEGTLGHLMGREVDTRIVPAPKLDAIKADAGQIEQVIMNMAINSRGAMPHGGKLTLETKNIHLDQEAAVEYPELKPGNYVMLAITDTGTGMSAEIRARVFEPFFSTKGVGEGAGLGLATCYGIIKQSGGHISVYSELGRGSVFKIYLPRSGSSATKSLLPRPGLPDLPGGKETILIAEDDVSLLEMSAALLRRLGYTVLTAGNGVEALSLKQPRNAEHVNLLLTDVVMPHMSGRELSDRIRAMYPHAKILFTSAYTENSIVHQGILDEDVTLLQKPFTPSALALKVREVLDQASSPQK